MKNSEKVKLFTKLLFRTPSEFEILAIAAMQQYSAAAELRRLDRDNIEEMTRKCLRGENDGDS